VSRRAFWQLLEGVRATGVAIVCATANMQEAERCDCVALMRQGRFARVGAPLALIGAVRSQLVTASDARPSELVARLRRSEDVECAFRVGRQVRAWLRAGTDAPRLSAALGQPGLQWQPAAPSLHDVALRELALAQREAARA